jgi:hypothetical protein
MPKQHLFIAGCPRSGTSPLTRLLASNREVILGMERYANLLSVGNFKLTPEHFGEKRFFEVEVGDTFYSDFDEFHQLMPGLVDRYETAKVIGDKKPSLYKVYDEIFETFPEAKILFIYRDVYSVASSFQARVDNKSWSKAKDAFLAVNDWNQSLFLTREAIKQGRNIRCVDYESVFLSNKSLKPMFDFIGVAYNRRVKKALKKIRLRSLALGTKRELLLTTEHRQYIDDNAKFFMSEFMAKNNVLSEAPRNHNNPLLRFWKWCSS